MMRLLPSMGPNCKLHHDGAPARALIEELKKFVASLEHACVAAEKYDDPRAIKQLEQMLTEAREMLKRAETELNN
jgi:hypothetical protein